MLAVRVNDLSRIMRAGSVGGPTLQSYTFQAAAKCLPCFVNGPLGQR